MKHSYPYLIISLIWLLILLLIDHRGEFPLIDDWAYAHGVKDYLYEGVLKISDWVAMTQVAHLFMGVGWSKVFGYSLENLREMTMLVSFLGSIVFYWLTGYFSRSVVLRLVGTLILTVNPIWMYLSHTYMTDIPFTVLFFAIVGAIIWITEEQVSGQAGEQGSGQAGERVSGQAGKRAYWPIGLIACSLILLLSSVLVLMRQTGLGLGFSFLLWVLLMDRERRKALLLPAVVLVTAQVLTLVGYEWYMTEVGALSTRYHGASSLSWILGRPWWPVRAAYYVLIQVQYLGMFLLPLLPFVWRKWKLVGPGSFSRWAYVTAGVVVLGIGVAVGGDILMNPRYTHLMQYDTVGHVMTIDFTYERLEFSRNLYPLWVVLHGLGMGAIFLLIVLAVYSVQKSVRSEERAEGRGQGAEESAVHSAQKAVRSEERAGDRGQGKNKHGIDGLFTVFRFPFSVFRFLKSQCAFDLPVTWILLILGGYTVFISIGQFVFDRYLMLHLPLMILAVIYLVDEWQAGKRASGGEVEEWQAGKRASGDTAHRSTALPLNRSTALPLTFLILSFLFATIGIDDSFQWNRVRFGAIEDLVDQGITPHQIDGGAEYNSWQRTGPLQPLRLNEKSWWYVDGDDYAIAHEEIPGYERIAAYPFTRYYGLDRDTLYVIKRQAGEQVSGQTGEQVSGQAGEQVSR